MTYTGKPGLDHVEVGKTYWVKNGHWAFTVLSIEDGIVNVRHARGEAPISMLESGSDRSPLWIEEYDPEKHF